MVSLEGSAVDAASKGCLREIVDSPNDVTLARMRPYDHPRANIATSANDGLALDVAPGRDSHVNIRDRNTIFGHTDLVRLDPLDLRP